MVENVLLDICRLCLCESENCIYMFSDEGDKLQIKEKITSIFHFEITQSSSISATICTICYEIINNFYIFFKKVISNQTYLNTIEKLKYQNEKEELNKNNKPAKVFQLESTEAISNVQQLPEKNDCLPKFGDLTCLTNSASPEVKLETISYQIPNNCEYDSYGDADDFIPDEPFLCYNENHVKVEISLPDIEKNVKEKTNKTVYKRKTRKKNVKIKENSENIKNRKQIDDSLPEHLKMRMTKAKSDAQIKEFVSLFCDICNNKKDHQTFKNLQEHFQTSHKTKGYVICCDKKIFRKDRLMNHIINHINPDAFACPDCGQKSKSKILLRIHMKQHLPAEERPFKCDNCDQRFVLKSQLTNHKASHFTQEEKRFVCEECGKAFALNFVMIKHKLTHSKERNFVCEVCAKSFSSKSNLQSHMTHHSNASIPRVQCSFCALWYKNIDTLRTHMRRHRDQRSHICSTCNKECSTRSSLAAHIRYVHLKISDFECNICNKQFRRRLELTEHMARHTGEILYKCPYCPKTFSSSSNYFAHRKNRHPPQSTNRDTKLPYIEKGNI